ncbi:hypothetical protein SO802_029932 [Lithocarpus litseifolius]|uniref:Uncharacterized protein n=1 Tax=Lithocarpus litseifolius TaxID=425828 RepID=A0AAW2BVK6_9ROSI
MTGVPLIQLDALTDVTFGVQLNVFECGAIVIGACIKDLFGYVPDFGITKERHVFDASLIETLRAKYVDNEGRENRKQPSKDASGPEKLYTVNLRPRTDSPQPQSSFRNLFSIAITIPILKNGNKGHGLVRQVLEKVKSKKIT